MKRLFFNLVEAIRSGCLRIFPRAKDLFLLNHWAIVAACLFLLWAGCSTSRQVTTQVVRDVRTDTIYINKMQYDSIFVSHDHTTDYRRGSLPNESAECAESVFRPPSPDTLVIHDRTVEYRYRLLRDTVFKTRVDSIPYEITVVNTKVERYVPVWAKLLAALGGAALLILILRLTKKFI